MILDDLAFVFPGQGSQKIGMLAAAADAHPSVKQTFDEAADALGPQGNFFNFFVGKFLYQVVGVNDGSNND